jgi:dTDP-4-dehydrorhamnose reductase
MSSARSVLLLGASGLLGGALARTLGERVAARTHLAHALPGGARFDARSSSVAELLKGLAARPRVAVVLLGITNIDACAKDPAGTAAVNVQGVTRVIRELSALGILPVFTSSDAVFDGTRAWSTEEDEARPILTVVDGTIAEAPRTCARWLDSRPRARRGYRLRHRPVLHACGGG